MTRWVPALCAVTVILVCHADASELVGSLRPKPNCDFNYEDCSNLVEVYTRREVNQAIQKAVESLRKTYDAELSNLKATVAAQSQQIAELRERAGLR